ncbi:MAG: hypothetical protein DMG18_12510 [Acidobacteria bacterium]|nr:MAG: hypothetical protein DMG18_12510 [Acidobacteriota bacterium]
MGRGCETSRYGSRSECEASCGRRQAGQHRRIFGSKHPRPRQGRQQGQLRCGGLRAGGARDPGRTATEGQLGKAVDRGISHLRPDAALASAAKVVEAEYEMPFQGHTAISPAHALADPSNGQMTIYSNDMKSYGLRNGVAQFLEMPRDRVRVVWMDGPQAYGRTAADDAGFEAAFLAREIGRPVRVQWMRKEETAWDTKGPAFTFKVRGALDAQGNLVALDFNARAADYNHLGYNEADTVLIAQLMGRRRSMPAPGNADIPSDMYAIPNRRMVAEVVSLPMIWETPLRTGNLRDPNGPQVTLAQALPMTMDSDALARLLWSRRRQKPLAGTRVLRPNGLETETS